MTLESFKRSLSNPTPPNDISKAMEALWHDGRNDWESAHNIAQDIATNEGSWIHAYLHRKEGDHGNAAYWYRRAGKPFPDVSLEKEWEIIVDALSRKK